MDRSTDQLEFRDKDFGLDSPRGIKFGGVSSKKRLLTGGVVRPAPVQVDGSRTSHMPDIPPSLSTTYSLTRSNVGYCSVENNAQCRGPSQQDLLTMAYRPIPPYECTIGIAGLPEYPINQ
ncbi:ectonucleotide pyrophosphatase phosphodiesterase [Branchiostoma belcheri]|nr:ectonucleotide pyrophosphatase phosphodiesterase [Branchiostoma belcheri]